MNNGYTKSSITGNLFLNTPHVVTPSAITGMGFVVCRIVRPKPPFQWSAILRYHNNRAALHKEEQLFFSRSFVVLVFDD
jgi:hypothetical protein